MNWYLKVIRNYAVFTGRAGRKEYWMFFLIDFLIDSSIDLVAELGPSVLHDVSHFVGQLYTLGVLIPHTAVVIRRLHDTGRSGWWILCPIVPIVFLCQKSQRGDNRYGPPHLTLQ